MPTQPAASSAKLAQPINSVISACSAAWPGSSQPRMAVQRWHHTVSRTSRALQPSKPLYTRPAYGQQYGIAASRHLNNKSYSGSSYDFGPRRDVSAIQNRMICAWPSAQTSWLDRAPSRRSARCADRPAFARRHRSSMWRRAHSGRYARQTSPTAGSVRTARRQAFCATPVVSFGRSALATLRSPRLDR